MAKLRFTFGTMGSGKSTLANVRAGREDYEVTGGQVLYDGKDLREMALDADVRMIACQMTMDMFEYSLDDMIEGPELGGAATYIEVATQSHINLFI